MIRDIIPFRGKRGIGKNDLLSEFQNYIDQFFENIGIGDNRDGFNPKFDIVELKDKYKVDVELPGVSKDEVNILLENNVLRIKGEKKEEKKEEKGNYYISERSFGKFERSFRLPENADLEKIKASYKNGELKIIIPKKEIEKEFKAKKIDVE